MKFCNCLVLCKRDEQNELIQKLDLAVSFCKSERMGIYDIAKLT